MSIYHADLTIELMKLVFEHGGEEKEYTVNEIYELIYILPGDKYARKNAKKRIRSQLKIMELRGLLTIRETITERKTIEYKYKFNFQNDGRGEQKEA